jgi:5-oxopent-3-ene-1,2,5-tricarboxylate decarboxylase/2-hydroxyhepta-2,4-diene-1,7-dioate isomerase
MKRARVSYGGAIHSAVPHEAGLRLADGRVVGEGDVVWLPPFEARTIFALALNYADHAKELAFKAPEEPLVFLKGRNSLMGHRGVTRRPADAVFMHYECELAVVIGRTAKNLSVRQAMECVEGYTVANDYAIRNFLENYYRPNFRVKSRDTCTPIGPWLVDAADVPDPMKLRLSTHVNGKQTQDGNTRDMIFDVPTLISWLSSFMTLGPGDVILTGTPVGLADIHPGDEVVTEIEGVGRLVHTMADDASFGRGATG